MDTNKSLIEKLWFQPYTPFILLGLIILLIARFVYPSFQQAINPQHFAFPTATPTPNPPPPAKTEAQILEEIGKLLVLPTDEKPQFITISEIEKFKDQPFFKNAKNGDILLIYTKNKKAILYDPVANKIIDTAPISSSEPTPTTKSTSPASVVQPTPTVTPNTTPSVTPSPTDSPTPNP